MCPLAIHKLRSQVNIAASPALQLAQRSLALLCFLDLVEVCWLCRSIQGILRLVCSLHAPMRRLLAPYSITIRRLTLTFELQIIRLGRIVNDLLRFRASRLARIELEHRGRIGTVEAHQARPLLDQLNVLLRRQVRHLLPLLGDSSLISVHLIFNNLPELI